MRLLILLILTAGLAACTTITPTMQSGPAAEVTFDGLHRVDGTRMDSAWILPDIDLSQYDALMFESVGVSYQPVRQYRRYDTGADKFPLDERQRARLEKTIQEVMIEEFGQFQNYRVTDVAGPGVLKVTLGITDVISRIPPERTGARTSFYLRDLGQAVLIVEVRDSVTNQALARIVDREKVESVHLQESNPVTNLSEVRRSVHKWGKSIREGLDNLHQIGCHFCTDPG